MGVDGLGFRQVFPTPGIAQQILDSEIARAFFMRLASNSNSRGVRSISPCSPEAVWASSSSVMPLAVTAWFAPGKSPPAPAAQKGAHAGDELAHAEGLRQVVVAADLEAHHLVELGVARGEEQHGHRGLRAQTAAQLVAVHAGQHDVEHEQVVGVSSWPRPARPRRCRPRR